MGGIDPENLKYSHNNLVSRSKQSNLPGLVH